MEQHSTSSEDVKIGYIYGLFANDKHLHLWECRYIGKTRQELKERLSEHLQDARRQSNISRYRNDWVRSVWARESEVVCIRFEQHEASSKEELNVILNEREIAWIAEGRRQGWRLTNGTSGGDGRVGAVVSDETRAKLSAAGKGNKRTLGYKHTAEARDNMSRAQRGRIITPEWREKIRIAKTGTHASEETKAKMSASQKGRSYNLGHHHSEATKAKISASKRGSVQSDEHKAKIRAALIGQKRTPEQIARMIEAQRIARSSRPREEN